MLHSARPSRTSHVLSRFGRLALLAAGLCLVTTPARADYPAVQLLLDTERSIVGEVLHFPETAPAKVTAVIVNIAPGSSTGWHRHGTPMFAYLLEGALDIEYATGKRTTVKAGDAFMEAMSVGHIGSNLGDTPARVLAVYMQGADSVKTLMLPAPDTPPASPAATRAPDLVDLAAFDPRLVLDIRYATRNNFMSEALYPHARAWLQRPVAEALRRAHDRLQAQGYALAVLDAYRPWQVTRALWDRFPKARAYLADPLQGSRHNRGAAVDVTLVDLSSGAQVEMPSDYDDFSARAHPDYPGGTPEQRAARDRLRAAMEAEGFSVYANEWWHFDHRDWPAYPLLNQALQ